MHTVHKTPRVTASQRATGDLEADVLVIPVFEDDTFADEPELDAAAGGDVSAAHARKEFRGTLYEVFQTHAGQPGRRRGSCWSVPESVRTAHPSASAALPRPPVWRHASAGRRGSLWCIGRAPA